MTFKIKNDASGYQKARQLHLIGTSRARVVPMFLLGHFDR